MFLIFPIALGLIVVSDEMIPLVLGKEFLRSANILKILLIATIFVSFANIFFSSIFNFFNQLFQDNMFLLLTFFQHNILHQKKKIKFML